jgi:hypothetical protein
MCDLHYWRLRYLSVKEKPNRNNDYAQMLTGKETK